MKKKIILVSVVLVVLITLISIPKSTYQKWFGKTGTEEPTTGETLYQTVFVVDSNNKLVGLRVPVEEIEEDQIRQKWNLLTSNMNSIPTGYSSPITPSTVLNEYSVEENKLILNVSEEINKSSGRLAIESLAWTFCDNNISEIVLKVDGHVISSINDYNFKKISKSMGTNFTYETAYLFEADYTTIVFYENDLIKPVTYFYKDISEYDFMISKVFAANDLEEVGYTYEALEGDFVINFDEGLTLSENAQKTLVETIKLNMDFDTLTVNGVATTIYEQVLEEAN